ncbi:MAG TPA: cell division protein FtsZ, partial [Devosia sp.]|nr:cell division protein FtsZ [Devosia sp.]
APEEPRNARALFKRLASNVGLNLGHSQPVEAPEPMRSSADDAAARSAIEAGGARVARSSAVEGARGSLDAHGRQPNSPPPKESLEIPAFLRKHG